ncbi:carbonic anhydrase [Zunongwangia sp.]|uniref:carbonic anhydrase n=1 Tax=Zunongwangia sp. TaxID=1965325 RepID=UPI003AA9C141
MKTSILVMIALILFSCKNNNEDSVATKTSTEKNPEHHWTYQGETGPEHWSEIEKDSDCSGDRQSPINIIEVNVKKNASLSALDIHYSDEVKIHEVTNNGHSIQYNFEKGDYIKVDGQQYDLKQIHFHEASEHTVNGVRYPLEIHLVHTGSNQEIVVLSILVEEGKNSEPFTFLEQFLPIKKGETKAIDKNFDLNLNFPADKSYYTYKGSLTTPPCTENVTWFVFKQPITVALDQVKLLQDLMPINNYRTEQPINDRIVESYDIE